MFGASQGLTMGFGASQATQGQAKGDRKDLKEICVPVTIRAIELAVAEGGDDIKINGQEASMLILVAAVEAVNKQTTSIELTVNDGTGRLKARHFITDESDSKHLDGIVVGSYVNMYGNVRTAPMVHLAVNGIRTVKSADEVSYHAIEVAHSFLKMQQGSPDPFTASPKKAFPAAAEPPSAAAEILSPTKAPEVAAAPATLTGDQLKPAILALFQKECEGRGEKGFHIDELVTHFAPAGKDQVKTALNQLIEEGDAFTTIDDDHFGCIV